MNLLIAPTVIKTNEKMKIYLIYLTFNYIHIEYKHKLWLYRNSLKFVTLKNELYFALFKKNLQNIKA